MSTKRSRITILKLNDMYLVGNGKVILVADVEFTTEIGKAKVFNNIGDAMRECIRLNGLGLGFATKFKVIPLG